MDDDRALFSLSWAPPDGAMHGKLATVSAAGQIIIWDTETGVQVRPEGAHSNT